MERTLKRPPDRPPRLTYIGHGTVLVEMDGLRVLTDPVLMKKVKVLRRRGRPVDPLSYRRIDAALISHSHWDHLHMPSLRLLDEKTRLIVPRGGFGALRRRRFQHVDELSPGESIDLSGLTIEATEANHAGFGPPMVPTGQAIGFLVRGSRQVYFAGDTDLFPGMADLARGLDAALLPVWGWGPTLGSGHLDPYRAAQALQLLEPRVAVPIHWGTLYPLGLGRSDRSWLTRPPVDFAEHAAELAPGVDVRILPPGGSMVLRE